MAFGGIKTMNLHTITNQKQSATTEGTIEGRRDEREAWGIAMSLFFGGTKSNLKVKN